MQQVFEGIVYVLRTGCQWKALPKALSWRGEKLPSRHGSKLWPL